MCGTNISKSLPLPLAQKLYTILKEAAASKDGLDRAKLEPTELAEAHRNIIQLYNETNPEKISNKLNNLDMYHPLYDGKEFLLNVSGRLELLDRFLQFFNNHSPMQSGNWKGDNPGEINNWRKRVLFHFTEIKARQSSITPEESSRYYVRSRLNKFGENEYDLFEFSGKATYCLPFKAGNPVYHDRTSACVNHHE